MITLTPLYVDDRLCPGTRSCDYAPQSKQAETAAVPSKLPLEIDAEPEFTLTIACFTAGLKKLLQQTSPDTVVAIRGDQAVTYQTLIDLLDLLKQYHFTKLSFEVKKIEYEP